MSDRKWQFYSQWWDPYILDTSSPQRFSWIRMRFFVGVSVSASMTRWVTNAHYLYHLTFPFELFIVSKSHYTFFVDHFASSSKRFTSQIVRIGCHPRPNFEFFFCQFWTRRFFVFWSKCLKFPLLPGGQGIWIEQTHRHWAPEAEIIERNFLHLFSKGA